MEENQNIEQQADNGQPPKEHFPEDSHAPQPQTTNLSSEALSKEGIKLQTENMEVHHHTHSTHGKKNWKNYFWEFLMLFLAVFCGFLAEYYLEHRIEKDRETQYMESMLEDLQRDTVGIQVVYELGQAQKFLMDTLLEVMNSDSLIGDRDAKLYLRNLNTTRIVNIDFEDRTASQLKNAGGMRLVRKKAVADSILGYWRAAEICDAISARLERIGEKRFDVQTKLFDNKYYILNNVPLIPASGIKKGAKLISNEPALMAEYSNFTFAKRAVLNNYLSRMLITKLKAVELMGVMRKEYHLK